MQRSHRCHLRRRRPRLHLLVLDSLREATSRVSVLHFLSVTRKKTVSSGFFLKTSCLGGRLSDYRNHSKNSLRSDSFSCRFACLAYATQESKKIPIIVHPINTSSCGMFFERSLMTLFSETNSQSRSPHFVLHVFSDKSSKTFLDEPSDKSITALRASCFFG